MAWPTPSEYQDAIQNPRACFIDPELQWGVAALTPMGIPRPFSGGHASVYRISGGGHTWAVRCFLRNLPDQQRRYEAIDRYLRATSLPCKVNFAYQSAGIRVGGAAYPVVKMEWVEGTPLNRHVESLLGDRPALRRLADDWRALIESLKAAHIAHGDLYHDNVLIAAGGTFRLIDYDGMYVPALAGQPGHEIGHPSYQHPRRSPQDFGPSMDRFSAFAIHLALVALSYEPALWAQFNNDDNLLFGREDFLNSSASRLFATLLRMDEAVAARARLLQAACAAEVASAPDLDAAGDVPVQAEPTAVERDRPGPVVNAPANLPAWLLDHLRVEPSQSALAAASSDAHSGPDEAAAPVAAAASSSSPAPPDAPFVFSFTQAWQRPGEKLVAMIRQRAVFEEETRLAVKTEVVNNTEMGVLVYVALQVLVLATLPGMVVVTLLAGLFIFQLVKRTREVEFLEPYQKQVGTRPVEELTTQKLIGHREIVRSVAFSQDGHQLASASDDGYAFVWRTETGERLAGLGPHEQKVTGVAAAGPAHFATASWDQQIRLWHHTGRQEQVFQLAELKSRFYAVAASEDGALIAGAIGQKQVKVWDARTGAEVATLRGHLRKVLSIAFLHNGRRLVSCSSDMTVRVWDVAAEHCERVLYGHTDEVNAVAVSGDGEHLASGARDGTVFIWNAHSGKQVLRINAKTREVFALAFSPHGEFLISGGDDATVRCWDISTGQETGQLVEHQGAVRSVAISPDGRHIASAGDDGRVILWTRIAARAFYEGAHPSQPSHAYLSSEARRERKMLDVAPNGRQHCPRCGKPLRIVPIGIPFWGCTDFPACPYAVKI